MGFLLLLFGIASLGWALFTSLLWIPLVETLFYNDTLFMVWIFAAVTAATIFCLILAVAQLPYKLT